MPLVSLPNSEQVYTTVFPMTELQRIPGGNVYSQVSARFLNVTKA